MPIRSATTPRVAELARRTAVNLAFPEADPPITPRGVEAVAET
jgi:hypothetical protein